MESVADEQLVAGGRMLLERPTVCAHAPWCLGLLRASVVVRDSLGSCSANVTATRPIQKARGESTIRLWT
jgi:hypothetical protein